MNNVMHERIIQLIPVAAKRQFVVLTNKGRIFTAKVDESLQSIHWHSLGLPDFGRWPVARAVPGGKV